MNDEITFDFLNVSKNNYLEKQLTFGGDSENKLARNERYSFSISNHCNTQIQIESLTTDEDIDADVILADFLNDCKSVNTKNYEKDFSNSDFKCPISKNDEFFDWSEILSDFASETKMVKSSFCEPDVSFSYICGSQQNQSNVTDKKVPKHDFFKSSSLPSSDSSDDSDQSSSLQGVSVDSGISCALSSGSDSSPKSDQSPITKLDSLSEFLADNNSESNLNELSDTNDSDDGISMLDLYKSVNGQQNSEQNSMGNYQKRQPDCNNGNMSTIFNTALNVYDDFKKSNGFDSYTNGRFSKINSDSIDEVDLSSAVNLNICLKNKKTDAEIFQKQNDDKNHDDSLPTELFIYETFAAKIPNKSKTAVNKNQSQFFKALSCKMKREPLLLQKVRNIKSEMSENLYKHRLSFVQSVSKPFVAHFSQSHFCNNDGHRTYPLQNIL